MAGARFWATCGEALKAAAATFFIPWFIIYSPVLILRPESFVSGLIGIICCVIGLSSFELALSGYLMNPLGFIERAGFMLGAVLLFATVFCHQNVFLGVGLLILALAFIFHWIRHRSYITTGKPVG